MSDHRLAELAALEDFAWIIEDGADQERIIADTYAAHAGEVAALRAEILAVVAEVARPDDLQFDRLEDGSVRVSLGLLVTPAGFSRDVRGGL